jgi:cytidylate kinase
VTISRQFGAFGRPVGLELARRLSAEFLDREIVAAVAERAGIAVSEAEGYDEKVPSLWQRVAAALATGTPDPVMPPLPSELVPGPAVHERLAGLTRAVIEEAAQRGNAVILGRGSAFILADWPGALHVQLHAPLEIRVRSLVGRVQEIPVEEIPEDTRPDEASIRELCLSMDARRAAYVRRLFDADWLDPVHYDLSIDAGRLSVRDIVDLVELAARRRAGAPGQPADLDEEP